MLIAGVDNGDELNVHLTDDPLDVVAKVLGLVPAVALVGVLLCHIWFGRCLFKRPFLTAVWSGLRVHETFSCKVNFFTGFLATFLMYLLFIDNLYLSNGQCPLTKGIFYT